MQEMRSFSAPWGLRVTLMTGVALVIFLGPVVTLLLAGLMENPGLALLAGSLLLVCITFLLLVARAYRIQGYVVSRDGVVVLRPGKNLSFDLAELESVEIDPKAMRWTYKACNGGLFSFGGKNCRNRRLGRYDAYATDPARSVVLRFPDRIVVMTPDDPHAFVEAIEAVRVSV